MKIIKMSVFTDAVNCFGLYALLSLKAWPKAKVCPDFTGTNSVQIFL